MVRPLDNRASAITVNGLSFDNLSQANQALGQDLKQLKGKTAISPADALKFIGDYNEREVYRAFGADQRRIPGSGAACYSAHGLY